MDISSKYMIDSIINVNFERQKLLLHNGRTQLLLKGRGIQIFWTANREAISQWTIVKEEKDCQWPVNWLSIDDLFLP